MDEGGEVVTASVAICPRCDVPSLVGRDGTTVPAALFAEAVDHLPDDVETLYEEARRAVAQGAPNAAALACRKILMHVGVQKGAPEGKSFLSYVNYLSDTDTSRQTRETGSTKSASMGTTRITKSISSRLARRKPRSSSRP